MPSPFPGMDPWLEHPAIFPDLHDSLIFCLREALNAVLPPPYFAAIGSRVWVELTERRVEPDVDVLRPVTAANGGPVPTSGGVAVAEVTLAGAVVVPSAGRPPGETMRQTFVGVYAQPGGERLVTTVEVLSLTNKTRGMHGRDQYLQKQEESLRSSVNLIEIDLLRCGEHSTAVPREEAVARTGGFDYHVCVHLFQRPLDFFVYAIRLADRLPTITVPLLPGENVQINLQPLLDRCYDTGVYARRIRYADNPHPPLLPEQLGWARETLRTRTGGTE